MIVVTVNQQGVPPAVASGSSEPCLPPTPAADRPAPRHRSRSGPVRRHRRRRCEAGLLVLPLVRAPVGTGQHPGPDLPCTHDRQPRYDRPGAQAPLVLLVVPDGEDRIGFVLLDVAELCRSPDVAWSALRRAWTRLAEQRRERAGHGHGHGRAGPVRDGQAVTAGLTDRVWKSCSRCGRRKRLETGFYQDKSRPDGRMSRCRDCVDAVTRAYRQTEAGKAAVAAVSRRRRDADPEKARSSGRRSYQNHRDARHAAAALYREAHRDKAKVTARRRRPEDPERARASGATYRQAHRAELAAASRRWYAANQEQRRAYAARRMVKFGRSVREARASCQRCGRTFSTLIAWAVCHPGLTCLDPAGERLAGRKSKDGPVWGFTARRLTAAQMRRAADALA